MKRIDIVLVLVVLLVTIVGTARAGEEDFTADGGLRLYPVGGTGFGAYDAATDGDATIKFMWLKKDGTVNAGDVIRTDPDGEPGNDYYLLRAAYPPRHFTFSGAPDSVYVDLDGATEVILTW